MTKAERLIYLVNMIKNRGAIYVKDMANECGISDRTIYRDLKSLSRMNIPLYNQNGYRLVRDTNVPFMDLTFDDLELIRYALRFNPLADNQFFKTKLKVIEQKIIEKGKTKQKTDNSEVFIFDECHETGDKKRGVEMLSQFIMAIFEKRKIRLNLNGDGQNLLTCTPIAVKIVQSKPALIVVKENDQETMELDLQTIIDMRLSDEKYNSQDRGYYKNLNIKKVDVAS